jgi:hypothetical protein
MSEPAGTPVSRDPAGRFVPGQSGNPAGKAPGTRNRATLLRELMEEGEDRAIVRLVIDKAKSGDAVAARFVVAHLCPRPRARSIEIPLADGQPAHNVVAAHDAVLRALFAGEIAPDEAEAVTRVLDARMRAIKARGQEEYLMACDPHFPAMAPPAATRAAPSPARGAGCGPRGGGGAAAPSPAGTPPAQAAPPAPAADARRVAPDRAAGPPQHSVAPADLLHSACIGTPPAPESSLPDTPAHRALDDALFPATIGRSSRHEMPPPADAQDSA